MFRLFPSSATLSGSSEFDANMMKRCLQLARFGEGQTRPNPIVGCVVVDSTGTVRGEGYHPKAGMPHAEVYALNEAGTHSIDGTLYVNLEPCCHYGRTPPCARAIVENGIRRVVVGTVDRSSIVSGKGIRYLRSHGVEVVMCTSSLEAECYSANRPFFHYSATGLPLGTMKYAMTLDGKIATTTGSSKWISSDESRHEVQKMRCRVDAIVVGAETVRADDPRLTPRITLSELYDGIPFPNTFQYSSTSTSATSATSSYDTPLRCEQSRREPGESQYPRINKIHSHVADPASSQAHSQARLRAPETLSSHTQTIHTHSLAADCPPLLRDTMHAQELQHTRHVQHASDSTRALHLPQEHLRPPPASHVCPRMFPLRVVMSRSLDFPPRANLWNTDGGHRTIVACSEEAFVRKSELVEALRDQGVEFLVFATADELQPINVCKRLAEAHDVRSILWECGGRLAGQAITQGCIHRIAAFVSPKISGGGSEAPSPIGDVGVLDMANALALESPTFRPVGSDLLVSGDLNNVPSK